MPAESIGRLGEEVIKWQNELARLRNSGLKDTALSVINAIKNLNAAKLAERAATGSQRGIGLPGASGSGLFALGLPNPDASFNPQTGHFAFNDENYNPRSIGDFISSFLGWNLSQGQIGFNNSIPAASTSTY